MRKKERSHGQHPLWGRKCIRPWSGLNVLPLLSITWKYFCPWLVFPFSHYFISWQRFPHLGEPSSVLPGAEQKIFGRMAPHGTTKTLDKVISAHLVLKQWILCRAFSITRISSQIALSPRAASSLVSTQMAAGAALLPRSVSTQETNPPTASVNDQSKF